jgi:hypothetical protein
MHWRAQAVIHLGQELWRCLMVVVLFLIGGAAVLFWTAAMEVLELIFWRAALDRQKFGKVFDR